jgi:hypothetical protein
LIGRRLVVADREGNGTGAAIGRDALIGDGRNGWGQVATHDIGEGGADDEIVDEHDADAAGLPEGEGTDSGQAGANRIRGGDTRISLRAWVDPNGALAGGQLVANNDRVVRIERKVRFNLARRGSRARAVAHTQSKAAGSSVCGCGPDASTGTRGVQMCEVGAQVTR